MKFFLLALIFSCLTSCVVFSSGLQDIKTEIDKDEIRISFFPYCSEVINSDDAHKKLFFRDQLNHATVALNKKVEQKLDLSAGELESMTALACCYENNLGCKQSSTNKKKALFWYSMAEQFGDKLGTLYTGLVYYLGLLGANKNNELALKQFKKVENDFDLSKILIENILLSRGAENKKNSNNARPVTIKKVLLGASVKRKLSSQGAAAQKALWGRVHSDISKIEARHKVLFGKLQTIKTLETDFDSESLSSIILAAFDAFKLTMATIDDLPTACKHIAVITTATDNYEKKVEQMELLIKKYNQEGTGTKKNEKISDMLSFDVGNEVISKKEVLEQASKRLEKEEGVKKKKKNRKHKKKKAKVQLAKKSLGSPPLPRDDEDVLFEAPKPYAEIAYDERGLPADLIPKFREIWNELKKAEGDEDGSAMRHGVGLLSSMPGGYAFSKLKDPASYAKIVGATDAYEMRLNGQFRAIIAFQKVDPQVHKGPSNKPIYRLCGNKIYADNLHSN